MVYTEFYKLVNKGYLECKKYRKNTFYKLTDKGFKNRFLFTQKAMAEEMRDLMIKRFGKSPLSIDQSIKYCGEMILNGASKKVYHFIESLKKVQIFNTNGEKMKITITRILVKFIMKKLI